MKYLIISGSNSLSHIVKSITISKGLKARGHEVLVAASRQHIRYLKQFEIGNTLLPDIQESDHASMPTVEWFRDLRLLEKCIKAETELIKASQPDRVIGIFRATAKISAELTGTPYDSLVCGCILPESEEILGFAENEKGRELQKENMEGFFLYCASKVSKVLKSFGLNGVRDFRELLKGDRTILWDFPEFMPLPGSASGNFYHVGPLFSNDWPYDQADLGAFGKADRPLAVITFGTCYAREDVVERLARILIEDGYKVLIASGGQKKLFNILPGHENLMIQKFTPLHEILPEASLVVSHGGQMTLFEAIYHQTPVLVMPSQPEQAHNGYCLERIGCGRRLVPPQPFMGDPGVYVDAFNAMKDVELLETIYSVTENHDTPLHLARARGIIDKYIKNDVLISRLIEAR